MLDSFKVIIRVPGNWIPDSLQLLSGFRVTPQLVVPKILPPLLGGVIVISQVSDSVKWVLQKESWTNLAI